ncbi:MULTISPECIES: CBS domain-containing protein [Desulfitobacterium]|uniref:CBS domain-containing protein n=1 Tax=Desulfitobacterium sp. LBE TaxID=884086 RepID=UPI0002ED1925|nr:MULTISPECIES: CBS domain-containing protein [Desulfitobacterium]
MHAKKETIQTLAEIVQPVDRVLANTTTAKDALQMINTAAYGIIPVVNETQKVVGAVTRGSLLSFFANQWSGEGEDADEK